MADTPKPREKENEMNDPDQTPPTLIDDVIELTVPSAQPEHELPTGRSVSLASWLTGGIHTPIGCAKYTFAIGRLVRGPVKYILASSETCFVLDDESNKLVVFDSEVDGDDQPSTQLIIIDGRESVVIGEVSDELFRKIAEEKEIVWTGIPIVRQA